MTRERDLGSIHPPSTGKILGWLNILKEKPAAVHVVRKHTHTQILLSLDTTEKQKCYFYYLSLGYSSLKSLRFLSEQTRFKILATISFFCQRPFHSWNKQKITFMYVCIYSSICTYYSYSEVSHTNTICTCFVPRKIIIKMPPILWNMTKGENIYSLYVCIIYFSYMINTLKNTTYKWMYVLAIIPSYYFRAFWIWMQ